MRAEPVESVGGVNARPVEEKSVEAVVIGSGFGGAVAACRLAQAGIDVLVLERGRRYQAGDFPALPPDSALLPDLRRWSWQSNEGLWDVVDLEELISVQAAGYGGGSLVYANVHLRPPDAVFDKHWPDSYTRGENLQEFFDLGAYMLEVEPVTAHPEFASKLVKADQLRKVAERLGRQDSFFHPPLAISYAKRVNAHGVEQAACTQCGQCSSGCPSTAKNTLDFNYLAVAERRGAKVLTQCEVMDIEQPGPDKQLSPNEWLVHCMNHLTAERFPIRAKYVFLCAGSIHSTRLLARAKLRPESRSVQSRVGVGYFPGGDALGMVYETTHSQNPSIGPTITTTLVHHDSLEDGSFFMIQDGGYPPQLDRILGVLRAPVWMGRNRLSEVGKAAIDSSPGPAQNGSEAPAPGFILASPVDDLLDAYSAGEFKSVVPPKLREAFPKFLKELLGPTLLPEIVERTIDESLRAQIAKRWPGGAPNPKNLVLRAILWFAKKVIIRFAVGTNAELAYRALTAGVSAAGLRRAEVVERTLGYAAVKPERRAMLLGMGTDAASGHLQYDWSRDRLIADLEIFKLSPGYTKQERLMTDIARTLGGELRTNPAWAFLGKPITVHNQGGCRMSDKPARGVTTRDGAVWGCPGLYVLDGAVLCSSVGVNPSATITAIAEKNVLEFIRAYKGNGAWPNNDAAEGAREYQLHRDAAADWIKEARRKKWHLTVPRRLGKEFVSHALGLKCSELMQGYYQPTEHRPESEPDYRRYETAGRPDYPITLKLDARIEDLATFFEDPAHEMKLSGTVRIRLPGEAKANPRGVQGRLELMVERYKPYGITPDQHGRLEAQKFAAGDYTTRAGLAPKKPQRFMNYWVSFQDEEQRYWLLRGYKRIRDDAGLDAWRDTSSLFVVLLGPSAHPLPLGPLAHPFPLNEGMADPIAGAGVVHVDLTGFLFDQLRSIEITGTEDPARIVWATTKFATFFFGALQRVYLPEINAALEALFAPHPTNVLLNPPSLENKPLPQPLLPN